MKFGPTEREEVEGFLRELAWEDTPLGGFVVGERGRKEERERVLREGRREEGKGRRDREVGEREDEFEGEEEGDEMEVEEE